MKKPENSDKHAKNIKLRPAANGHDPEATLRSVARGIISITRSKMQREQFVRDLLAKDEWICGSSDINGMVFWRFGAVFAQVDRGQLIIRIPARAVDLPIPPHLAEWRPDGKVVPLWRIALGDTAEEWVELAIQSLILVEEEIESAYAQRRQEAAES